MTPRSSRASRSTPRGTRAAAAAIVAAALSSACSPTFDWRELRLADTPATFMLPAKPARMAREVTLAGETLTMHMAGARAGEHIFTAAWIDLRPPAGPTAPAAEAAVPPAVPPAVPGRADAVLAAMIEGMLANIGATDAVREQRSVGVAETVGAGVVQVPATWVRASGSANGRPVQMRALFAALPTQAHQFVIIAGSIDDAAAQTFFDSVRLNRLRAQAPS